MYLKKPKVFIMGLSSFLGFHLALKLRENFSVSGCYFNHPVRLKDVHAFPVRLTNDSEMLERLVSLQSPDFAISCVSLNDEKTIENNAKLAEAININIPLAFASAAIRSKSKHILLNCSEVLEGTSQNYDENTKDFATSGYGKMRATLEVYLKAQTMEGTVIRLGRILGPGHHHKNNFLDSLRSNLQLGKFFSCDPTLFHSYLSVTSACIGIEQVLLSPFPPNKQRNIHLGGPTANEEEICQIMSALFGLNTKYLKTTQPPSRRNLTMDTTFAESNLMWLPETKEELVKNVHTLYLPGKEAGLLKNVHTKATPRRPNRGMRKI